MRQTRGKFGLGAKMALIWAKKSTGLPIEVRTAHAKRKSDVPPYVTTCILDIDINRNVPIVHTHEQAPNEERWRGTEVALYVSGAWSAYRARVIQYLQQLAVITPYAALSLRYVSGAAPSRSFVMEFRRRSTQMPRRAAEVKLHPRAVNDLSFKQAIHADPGASVEALLVGSFSDMTRECVRARVRVRVRACACLAAGRGARHARE